MSGSVNKVILVGNLGKDPEIRSTQDGSKIANLSIATSERWKNKTTGEQQEKTEWHRVVIFNEHIVNIVEQYTRKGSTVYIEGQLQTRKWVDKENIEKYSTEIVLPRFRGELTLLGGRADGGQQQQATAQGYAQARGGRAGNTSPPIAPAGGLDDDIPF